MSLSKAGEYGLLKIDSFCRESRGEGEYWLLLQLAIQATYPEDYQAFLESKLPFQEWLKQHGSVME